jgi:hypothetical protein
MIVAATVGFGLRLMAIRSGWYLPVGFSLIGPQSAES